MDLDTLVREFLNFLEGKEAKFLSWGYVDGGFDQEEIMEMAEALIYQHGGSVTPEELVEELLERKVLFQLNLHGRMLWRSRMAETVRLLSKMRQIFDAKKWRVAPTLVSDFRFSLRPRTYPQRHIPPNEVWEVLRDINLAGTKKRALAVMLDSQDRGPLQLAQFQLKATHRMLADLKMRQNRGMIVGAGTGTGKTLAFYLPALTHIAGLIKENEFWTKALAIYPRNELLKDQFSETFSECRRLDELMLDKGGRKIRIGAFFGSTPNKGWVKNNWEQKGNGYICPFFTCPDCGGILVWKSEDINNNQERLVCTSKGCTRVMGQDEILLTRESMAQSPPDILFTTTEMLNRNMADSEFGHIFGINAAKKPRVVLLDEVHTYKGIKGAQIAYLLRRWRHRVGGSIQFTGLSATLHDAEEFFATLVGLNQSQVEEIMPASQEMVQEGMEYLLALRGDPVSATSLLSTSIQTAMLMCRVMDPASRGNGRSLPSSKGLFGKKVFAFTDDLDVTNRFYHNMMDAEGLNQWGQAMAKRTPLAAFRSSILPDNAVRMTEGQSWYMCEQIGHPQGLTVPLRVGRTSSQDTGVDSASDIVIASASLEVGFNDPDVGVVIQHKAPMEMASFLQRKGRAGRNRKMRPWTVVVLSDYGRDRLAYQGYDYLFNPSLDRRMLPIGNRYVLRMQAVFAFMDWMYTQLPVRKWGGIWKDFSSPADKSAYIRERQRLDAFIIEKVLKESNTRSELEEYIAMALQIKQEEVQVLLWESPRPLITAVLPTMLRRLDTQWKKFAGADVEAGRELVSNSPLPEFVPPNLFSDLYLPEVEIKVPGRDKLEHLTVNQAMRIFAPGKVTRRFAVNNANHAHWVALELTAGRQNIPITKVTSLYEELGDYQIWQESRAVSIRCVRPWLTEPSLVPAQLNNTSNSQLVWQSQLYTMENGFKVDLPSGSRWQVLIHDIRFFTHSMRSCVKVRRFSVSARANLRLKTRQELEVEAQIVDEKGENPVAIGYEQEVDGIVFRFSIPDSFSLSAEDPNQGKIRSLRTAYFRHLILTTTDLDGLANMFQRDWLYQIYLSSLITHAIEKNITLAEAQKELEECNFAQQMAGVLETIFQTISLPEEENAETDEEQDQLKQKVHQKLLELCALQEVKDALHKHASVLWEQPDDKWQEWVKYKLKYTLGSTLLNACLSVSSQFGEQDLIMDMDPGPRPPETPQQDVDLEEIWISENTSGGGGVIEEIMRSICDDPRHFFRLADSCLKMNDFELVDSYLTQLLRLTESDAELNLSLSEVRAAENYQLLYASTVKLREVLLSRGILTTHQVMSAINTRILKAGSSEQSDKLMGDLINTWHTEEERLGIEIDLRVFAYVSSDNCLLDEAIAHIDPSQHDNATWRFQVIYGLLWPRGNTIKTQGLACYNPFVRQVDPNRDILRELLSVSEEDIDLTEPDWRTRIKKRLASEGTARLLVPHDQQAQLKKALLDLGVEPLDIGFLNVYPRLQGYERTENGYVALLEVGETF